MAGRVFGVPDGGGEEVHLGLALGYDKGLGGERAGLGMKHFAHERRADLGIGIAGALGVGRVPVFSRDAESGSSRASRSKNQHLKDL
jgi:hypothetical protein